MAKTLDAKIEAVKAEMKQKEALIKKLIQQQKAQERKDRTKRLCSRHGLFEKLLPDSINLTDEQFETFLRRTIAKDFGRGKLAEILGISLEEIKPVPAPVKKSSDTDTKTAPAETPQGGTAGGKNANQNNIAS